MDRLRAAIRHVRADYMPPAGDGAAGDGAAEDLLEAVYVFTRCRADEVGEDQALQEIVVAAIPPRAVHERMQKWAEFEAQFSVPLDLRRVETGRRATHDRLVAARAAGVAVEYLGDPAEYTGSAPIAARAVPPHVPWTAADRKLVMDAYIADFGLGPGEWIDVHWPPVAALQTAGRIVIAPMRPCDYHARTWTEPDGRCRDCVATLAVVVDEPARWSFTTRLARLALAFDGVGRPRFHTVFVAVAHTVGELEQDPRDVLLGPADGRGGGMLSGD
ncbi:hypothetical protein [Tsukamurella soli]